MQALIQTPTPYLEASIDFYSKLGFKQISETPLIFSDGKASLEINPNRYARAGLRFFKDSWSLEISKLKPIAEIHPTKDGHLLADPSGVWIFLVDGKPGFDLHEEELSFSTLGNYMGISLESTDAKKSFEIYQILGFQLAFGSVDSGYFSMTANGFSISIMKPNSCPHLFFNPSLTYFNGKNNMNIIAKIRSLEIPITEEITYFNKEGIVDNIIIKDPGGLGFFIFND
ncbi:VOC family protein [Cognataquiflexum rubidum]|uniref:VOC family protein n=1 Tax=Cognataquiflexum rubidum TaxID=2922273 RepID=UPI001F13959D|nr:VOC family protein [Cognataquiflexum rubidum]MCH6234988.1 VOC family protein [Cognataquiflexum rubidum]